MSDYQWVVPWCGYWTNQGTKACVGQPCLSPCGIQVWSTGMVINDEGEGHAGLCRWTESGEGWVLGIDRGTEEAG
jgi:hypothetical protein